MILFNEPIQYTRYAVVQWTVLAVWFYSHITHPSHISNQLIIVHCRPLCSRKFSSDQCRREIVQTEFRRCFDWIDYKSGSVTCKLIVSGSQSINHKFKTLSLHRGVPRSQKFVIIFIKRLLTLKYLIKEQQKRCSSISVSFKTSTQTHNSVKLVR